MKLFRLHYIALGFIFTAVFCAWLSWGSSAVASTYAAMLALVAGIAAVTIISWRNAQATDTVGQLLQRTEADGTARRR